MSENLHNLARILKAKMRPGDKAKMRPGDTFTWREITFNYLGYTPAHTYDFAVFSSKTANLSLLQVRFTTKGKVENYKKVKKYKRDFGELQSFLRLCQEGYMHLTECREGNFTRKEIFYRGRDFEENVLDEKKYFEVLISLYQKHQAKYKKFFPSPLRVVAEDLRNISQRAVDLPYSQIRISRYTSSRKVELLLRIWLYQRGYISIEEVLPLWNKILGQTPAEKLGYVLDHVPFLSISGLKKYLIKLNLREKPQNIFFFDDPDKCFKRPAGILRDLSINSYDVEDNGESEEVYKEDSFGEQNGEGFYREDFYIEEAPVEQKMAKITKFLKMGKQRGQPVPSRSTFYDYLKPYRSEIKKLKEDLKKLKEKLKKANTTDKRELLDGYNSKIELYNSYVKQALQEAKTKKQETIWRKELAELYKRKKKCSLNAAQVWVSRNVNSLKQKGWNIEGIYNHLRKILSAPDSTC